MEIDKIFIINLKQRTDRKEHMILEMKKQNIINFEFFDAIRPTIQDIIEWNPNFFSHVKRSMPSNKFLNYQFGCLGCLKSHLEVCKLALSRGYKNILILEDDTEFVQDFNKIYEYSNQINNTYDMLYLCGSHLGKKVNTTSNIIKVLGTHTTGSYLIKEEAMKYLIENINAYDKEIDVFYAHNLQNSLNCYCAIPHIARQKNGYSDIQQANVQYKLSC